MGGHKWPKMRQKTLNNIQMWKIFCIKVVVVVFVVFVLVVFSIVVAGVIVVVVVVVVVVVPDSGFDRKRKLRDTTISFLPEKDLEHQATIIL